MDAGEVRLSESSPSATRFRRAGRGRVEVITFKPLSKNPGALHDFNPIELAFAKLKAILRKARCRTREVLWNTIGAAVPGYDPAECRNYFRHCGYSVATTS